MAWACTAAITSALAVAAIHAWRLLSEQNIEEQTPCETPPVCEAGNESPFNLKFAVCDFVNEWIQNTAGQWIQVPAAHKAWIEGPNGQFTEAPPHNFFSVSEPEASSTASAEQRQHAANLKAVAKSLYLRKVVISRKQLNSQLFPEVIKAVVGLALAEKEKGD
jgi:hypothetical protein